MYGHMVLREMDLASDLRRVAVEFERSPPPRCVFGEMVNVDRWLKFGCWCVRSRSHVKTAFRDKRSSGPRSRAPTVRVFFL